MHMIYNGTFYSADPGQAEYKELYEDIFMPKLYDFAILHERTGEIGLLPHAVPEKTRVLYNEEHPCPPVLNEKNGVISVFLRPTESVLNYALRRQDNSLVYYSPMGFFRHRSTKWRDPSPDFEIDGRMKALAALVKERTVLFFGNLEHRRPEGLKGLFHKLAVNVKIIKFDPTKDNLYDTLLANRCFACLGLDGFSIGCWRDWELPVAAVPSLRYTMAQWHKPFANPCDNYWVVDHYETPVGLLDKIEQEMMDGTATARVLKARDYALAVMRNTDLSETLESLACDNEFFKAHIAEAEKAIPLFLEKAKQVKALHQPPFIRADRKPQVIKHSTRPSPLLSIIIPVKGRLKHLQSTLPTLISQENSEVVIVDYSCPEGTKDWLLDHKFDLGIVSVPDQDRFNLAAARNAGVKAAAGKAFCFLDCDMLLKPDFSKRILAMLEKGTLILFTDEGKNVRDGFAGMTTCFREDFLEAGMYDEGFLHWGCEDDDLKAKLKLLGLKPRKLDPSFAEHINHDDNDRIKYAHIPNRYDSWISNCNYRNRPMSIKQTKATSKNGFPVGVWRAVHRDWKGLVFILTDGTFQGGNVAPNGLWEYEKNILTLKWYQWKPESICKVNDKEFKSSFMSMKQIKDLHYGTSLESKSEIAQRDNPVPITKDTVDASIENEQFELSVNSTMDGDKISSITYTLKRGGFVFNNSIASFGKQIYMAYRLHNTQQSISEAWLANLDHSLGIVTRRRILQNAQDARLFVSNEELCCSYTSVGIFGREPEHMHVCKFDNELNVSFDKHLDRYEKQKEKNWQFFHNDLGTFCVYDYDPFTILKFDKGFNIIDVLTGPEVKWQYGTICGGTPPFMIGNLYYMIVHSLEYCDGPPNVRYSEKRRKYTNGLLSFDGNFVVQSIEPIHIDDYDLVYPCGFIHHDGRFLFSYGIDDSLCKIKFADKVGILCP